MKISYWIFLFLIPALFSCKNSSNFSVADFQPLSNIDHSKGDTVQIKMDLHDAVRNGITIPTKRQVEEGNFTFRFQLQNRQSLKQQFYYKIYYQNETYKYPDDSPEAADNFYGSWEDNPGFRKIYLDIRETATITDSFRIVGNPRNEKKYFGASLESMMITEDQVDRMVKKIESSSQWLNSVKVKAEKNNRSVEDQKVLDAVWMLENNQNRGETNNRWKRNPRVGVYSFMLVVATEAGYAKLPEYIKSLEKLNDNSYVNPFSYFAKEHIDDEDIIVLRGDKKLKLKASLDPDSGVYLNIFDLHKLELDSIYESVLCNSGEDLFRHANFAQFFHNQNRKNVLRNIPLVRDVTGEGYTREEYEHFKNKFSETELIEDYIGPTNAPCKTVFYEPDGDKLVLINPGNKANQFRKENTGIQTRFGFTYGKFRGKISFPRMLNDDNVWNGITNAFWLLYQSDDDWNHRKPCLPKGYLDKGGRGVESKRLMTTHYSEIDIEIVKASQYWPSTSYKGLKSPDDRPAENRDIIVACTNWDLACRQPSGFQPGAFDFWHKDKVYELHRWDDYYKAITTKIPVSHDKIFDRDYFYFEIEWQPASITWRIGPEKNDMREIAYMDSTVTSIPDNQMILVMTQEFHHAAWWPTAPFKQDYIPYPAKDLTGYIYEIEIE